jgi:hypothetical protein
MRVSLMMLVRLVAYLGLALSVVAVGVGRLIPPEPSGRRLGRLAVVFVNDYACGRLTAGTRFVDADSGQLRRIALPEGDRLDQASCAPWRDRSGQSQVVGRWSALCQRGPDLRNVGTGLGRFTFPDGKPLDRIVTEQFPTGPPCWAPETSALVVFAAGDGRLYRFNFEEEDPAAEKRPVPLVWSTGGPQGLGHYVCDPSWPAVPGLAGGLLASVSRRVESDGKARYLPPEVWWLRLSPRRDAILAAVPLTAATPAGARRFPLAAKAPDGGLTLVSLVKRRGCEGWSLAAARLTLDAASQELRGVEPDEAILAEDVCPTPPAVSADGRWVTVMVRDRDEARPRRIRITPGADPQLDRVQTPPPPARRGADNSHRPPQAGRASEPWA